MRDAIIRSLKARFQSYSDLIAEIDPGDLDAKLDVPRDKSVAEHLWCVVGARESYARALASGEWQGFSCSMSEFKREDFERSLASSARELLEAVRSVSEWSPAHDELLVAISEHEVMHEGQVIRHMYGLGRELPGSWKWA